MRIDDVASPNSDRGRGAGRPVGIVIHTTDGTFQAASTWFADPASGVSAHYLIALDGRIRRFVAEEDTARHAGVLVDPVAGVLATVGDDPNRTTVGIEFADDGDPGGVARPDAQYEAGGQLIAAVCARWDIPLDREYLIAHRDLRADKTCPGNLDLDRLVAEARRPLVAALLPVRNEAGRLRAWLDGARILADVVIALDDGSTDESAALLEADPLVVALLRDPVRPGYEDWNDADNRQCLLDAAAGVRPRWVVQLDADESIDAEDAAALRTFLETDALPGCAYGLRHHRAWGDLIDDREIWVYRVFAWRPELRLPHDRRLHFNPVPESIPRAAWLRTTIRLRHEGAGDDEGVAARARKYAEADPAGEYRANTGGMEASPNPSALVPWTARPSGSAVLVDPVEQAVAGRGRPHLVVLLPVRNGAEDLPGWLDAVQRFADAVVALDDGSTDGTLAALEADPLVATVLRNPVRKGFAGWNEAGDRQRLLQAAGELRPRFVFFLDVDERIAPDDVAPLRAFVESSARPGTAYGLRVHRMVREQPAGYDRADLWVYRLFAWAPDQRLPERGLHFLPVPVGLARRENTTIRLLHLASLTEERRRERYAKYEELDPDRLFQADYSHLLEPPGAIVALEPRPQGLAVVRTEDLDLEAPVLSAIVIAREDADRIERVVRSVVDQQTDERFEVIVVVSGSPRTAAVVEECFPEVTLVELDAPALPGAARNAGLSVARGDIASFPGSHIELAPGSLQARIEAHERGYPMVTGSVRNGTPIAAGWASYFLDHSTALPGRPAGELSAPPAHCSYDRGFLVEIGGFPSDLRAGEDTWVNTRLFAMGKKAWREPAIVFTHTSPCTTIGALIVHHFRRGRGLGRLWFDPALRMSGDRDTLRMILGYLPRRLRRVREAVAAWGTWEEHDALRRTWSLVVAAAIASWLGALTEGATQTVRRSTWR